MALTLSMIDGNFDIERSKLDVVKTDCSRRSLYVYFEEEPGRRAAAKLLTHDESRRIAANLAKLQELLWR